MTAPSPTGHGSAPTAGTLTLIAYAMASAIAALVVVAVVFRPRGEHALPDTVAWTLGGMAAACIVIGLLIGATADAASRGYAVRFIVSLALREMGGILGAVITLLGADVGWAVGLGGAAAVSLVALRPRQTAGA